MIEQAGEAACLPSPQGDGAIQRLCGTGSVARFIHVLYIAGLFRAHFVLNKARTKKGFSDTPKPTLSGLKADTPKFLETYA